METIFVGRQPIYDRNQSVYGYELLFRAASGDTESGLRNDGDGEQATSQVIINSFTEIGLDNIVGSSWAFINLTKDYLLHHDYSILPSERVVLELLEHVVVDKAVVSKVKELKQSSYVLALDNFVYNDSLRPLLDYVNFVKIDVRGFSDEEIQRNIEVLKPYGVTLLAAKIETHERYLKLWDMGFDYFQGFFFNRPNIVEGQAIPANRLSVLRLLGRLHDPKSKIEEMEEIISQDVTLSYKLLRYLNSSWFSLSKEVESIRAAIVYVGLNYMRSWATMVALSAISGKPHELTIVSLVRGRMCELLAKKAGAGYQDAKTFFTVGLFSTLDALMDKPMEELLHDMPLSHEVKAALLHYEGEKGLCLSCARAYEEGDWENVKHPTLEAEEIKEAYLEAIAWAREAGEQLQ